MGRAFMACSSVITLRICASGFSAPFSWFFTATADRCSRVVPKSCMWRRAIIANSDGNVEPARTSVAPVARARKNFGDAGGGLGGHLLDAQHHHDVVNSARDRHEGMEKGRAARSAGRLEPGGRECRIMPSAVEI